MIAEFEDRSDLTRQIGIGAAPLFSSTDTTGASTAIIGSGCTDIIFAAPAA